MLGESEYKVGKDGIVTKGGDHSGAIGGGPAESEDSKEVSVVPKKCTEMLGGILSDTKILAQGVQGLHWNMVGRQFFTLHDIYQELYDSLGEAADEIAERIRMVGGIPPHCFECFVKLGSLEPIMDTQDSVAGVKKVIEGLEHLRKTKGAMIEQVQSVMAESGILYGHGTIDMFVKMLAAHEKMVWQLMALTGENVGQGSKE